MSKRPELGVAGAGDTQDEARRNLQEAISLYIDNAEALGIMEDLTRILRSDSAHYWRIRDKSQANGNRCDEKMSNNLTYCLRIYYCFFMAMTA